MNAAQIMCQSKLAIAPEENNMAATNMTAEQIQDRLDKLEMSLKGDETDDDTRADILDEIAELEAKLEDQAA